MGQCWDILQALEAVATDGLDGADRNKLKELEKRLQGCQKVGCVIVRFIFENY